MTDAPTTENLTEVLNVRISAADLAEIDRLTWEITPMIPMSRADVVRWLIRKSAAARKQS